MLTIVTTVSIIILALLGIFQILLAFGMPLGRFAWGGQYERLPKRYRIGSALAPLIYAVFAIFITSRPGVWMTTKHETIITVGLWVIFTYFVIGVLLNGISRSKPERYTMTPICIVLAICLLIIVSAFK